MKFVVRPERAGDEPAISAVTAAAFAGQPHSEGSEVSIVERLRADGDLTLSLVGVTSDGAIVGHVAFSPVTVSDGSEGWFGLGPVSVRPDCQGSGIGSRLIKRGLERLREMRARGCVILGDPGYYGRFGFARDAQLRYPGPPAKYFQRRVLTGEPPCGVVAYARAFASGN